MDYDVITKNDFGGEAFMSLSTVPGGSKSQNMSSRFPRKITRRESVVVAGVEQGSSSVENFHGLKPLHLPLMFQKRRGGSRSHLQSGSLPHLEVGWGPRLGVRFPASLESGLVKLTWSHKLLEIISSNLSEAKPEL